MPWGEYYHLLEAVLAEFIIWPAWYQGQWVNEQFCAVWYWNLFVWIKVVVVGNQWWEMIDNAAIFKFSYFSKWVSYDEG